MELAPEPDGGHSGIIYIAAYLATRHPHPQTRRLQGSFLLLFFFSSNLITFVVCYYILIFVS
jgi:hypothetical protein